MVLKYGAVSTLPHHTMTYSWGTQQKGQPFNTLLLLAASSLLTGPGFTGDIQMLMLINAITLTAVILQ